MTEYEIADLAISKALHAQGLGATVLTQVNSSVEVIQQFMTVLFAFLVASYLMGASLSKKQTLIFAILYTAWQIWTLILLILKYLGLRITLMEFIESGAFDASPEELAEALSVAVFLGQIVLLSVALAASIYFMWDVRHPKIE